LLSNQINSFDFEIMAHNFRIFPSKHATYSGIILRLHRRRVIVTSWVDIENLPVQIDNLPAHSYSVLPVVVDTLAAPITAAATN
jgi:hypothetical protein